MRTNYEHWKGQECDRSNRFDLVPNASSHTRRQSSCIWPPRITIYALERLNAINARDDFVGTRNNKMQATRCAVGLFGIFANILRVIANTKERIGTIAKHTTQLNWTSIQLPMISWNFGQDHVPNESSIANCKIEMRHGCSSSLQQLYVVSVWVTWYSKLTTTSNWNDLWSKFFTWTSKRVSINRNFELNAVISRKWCS